MATNTKFPNGIETTDLKVTGNLTVEGEVTHASTEAIAVASVSTTGDIVATAGKVQGSFVNNAISVNCTNDVTLTGAQLLANVITISAAGSGKVLILGMPANKIVYIINAGANNVTVKNATANTGVAATTVKSAFFLTAAAAAEPIKMTADI